MWHYHLRLFCLNERFFCLGDQNWFSRDKNRSTNTWALGNRSRVFNHMKGFPTSIIKTSSVRTSQGLSSSNKCTRQYTSQFFYRLGTCKLFRDQQPNSSLRTWSKISEGRALLEICSIQNYTFCLSFITEMIHQKSKKKDKEERERAKS